MSTFAEWKKNNKVTDSTFHRAYHEQVYRIAHAAYKAGERQGRKDAEEIAKRAIELRVLLDSKK